MNIDGIVKLCTVENLTFAELCEDALFKKISGPDVKLYINSLIAIASARADKFKSGSRGARFSVLDICRSEGVSVNLIDNPCPRAVPVFRAEILYREKLINVMKSSVDQICGVLKNFNFNGLECIASFDYIKDMHIAHELYHFIEFSSGEYIQDELAGVTYFKIGGFEKKTGVAKASEAAAHIFCMKIMDAPFHPKLLDYLCMLDAGEISYEKLIGFLESIGYKDL
ncbi:MAG TPA: hypothetical protein PK467_20460 [Candidatus Wallbacteria bacterium]|nr:hypothetical protein [Candidatus Wallbacteria bacterium]